MTQINFPLGIESLTVISQTVDNKGAYIIEVVSNNDHSTCHKCGKPATKRNGYAPSRDVQHLSIFDTPVYLRIKPVRYQCQHCDKKPTTTEQYDWCERNATSTYALNEFMMRNLIHSTLEDVSKKLKISIARLRQSIDTQINQTVDWSSIDDLNTLGIDEISLRKGHSDFVTIVSTKSKNGNLRIIAVLEDRKKDTLSSFLLSIPDRLRNTVKHVCTDMYDGYVSAVIDVLGSKVLVIDRFHVAKLYRKPLDKLRIDEMKRLKHELDSEEYQKLEGMMWILRKKHECLSIDDKEKLDLLYKYSPKLKSAHKYAMKLTSIFNTHSSKKSAMAKINRWIQSIEKSNVTCFNSFVITLKKYQPYIMNYFKDRKNSGFVEGLNNKIKVAKRRCYGLCKTTSLFQRLFLDLQGYEIYV